MKLDIDKSIFIIIHFIRLADVPQIGVFFYVELVDNFYFDDCASPKCEFF